jgi:hypothetical protein
LDDDTLLLLDDDALQSVPTPMSTRDLSLTALFQTPYLNHRLLDATSPWTTIPSSSTTTTPSS